MNKFLKVIKTLLACIGIVISAVLVGYLLVTFVYCLPTGNKTEEHMKSTATTMAAEGVYPVVTPKAYSVLDNFTDSLMLLTAAEPGAPENNPFNSAIDTVNQSIKDKNPHEVLTGHYLDGAEFETPAKYNHYWHGYLVFLRPLIRLTDYHYIRILNLLAQVALVIIAIRLMVKQKRKVLILPLLIFYLSMCPLASAKSLQFSANFYLTMVSIIAILKMKELKSKKMTFFFLITGILTAFFDLLTFPLIVIGIPLALYLYLRNEKDLKKNFCEIVKNGFVWTFGYLGMWAGKWIIGGHDTFMRAMKELFLWTSSKDGPQLIDKWKWSIESNWNNFTNSPAYFLFQAFCIVMLTLIVAELYQRKKTLKLKAELKRIFITALPFFLIAMFSIAWYCIASGHCSHHSFMTFKTYTILTVSTMFGLLRIYITVKKPLSK
ncbi:hypothetical protein J6W91_03060 [Candidatus Saccharibacteria bacterium]|nr:hypothetical protein [Candidatus Saccharibacteria bacterium]